MIKPRLLDLFCGAGGGGTGYHRAGFEVIGVDIKPQPRYPFEFHRGDALAMLESVIERQAKGEANFFLGRIDAIHASPPCPRYSSISRVHGAAAMHPDLVLPVRELLLETGLPYIIENVVGAPLEHPTLLCGSSFGLGAKCKDGTWRQLRRHRLFEVNFVLMSPPCCHRGEPVGVYGHGGAQRKTVWNGGANRGYMADKLEASEALGIDWMNKRELSDAIPPAYTELIGHQLLAHLPSAHVGVSTSDREVA